MAKFDLIIQDYKQNSRGNPDPWLTDCARERDLIQVIEMAALALDKGNLKHPHQHRLQNKTLRKFADSLLRNADRLLRAKTFDDIYFIVNELKVHGIGPLTVYDTTHRIGVRRKIFPDQVYMHQGTKVGAERYLKRKVTEKALNKKLFPDFARLRCDEIEDILCIYKDGIKNGKCLISKVKKGGC